MWRGTCFHYAASYFGDPEAQYHLGRVHLGGQGVPKDPITAARWLQLSADKDDHRARKQNNAETSPFHALTMP